jgi:hypothetical protein
MSEHMWEGESLQKLQVLVKWGTFTHIWFVSFCERILHLVASYAKLDGL